MLKRSRATSIHGKDFEQSYILTCHTLLDCPGGGRGIVTLDFLKCTVIRIDLGTTYS